MAITKTAPSLKSAQKWFKTAKATGNTDTKVDRKKGVIYDVVIAQVGPAEGHGTNVEQQFIDELVAQGNKASQGVKVHFGHPSMSEQTLGSYAGRATNLRVKGEQAIADITLSPASQNSPKGNIYNYLLDLAEKEPDMFGMSVVTSGNWAYQYDDEWNMYSEKDDDWYDKYTSTRPLYEMFENFIDVDFVDQGALTPNGLFSVDINIDKFSVGTTDFLNKNPKIDQFLKDNPEKLIEFMSKRYGFNFSLNDKKSFADFFSKLFSSNPNNKMKKPKAKFDINAVTTDGIDLTIVTSDSAAKVDDAVNDTESGEPAQDGDYPIETSDDEALQGQTITIQGGVISAINPTESAADPAQKGKGNEFETQMSNQFKDLQTKYSALETKFNALEEENKMLRNRPKTVFSNVEKKKDAIEGGGKKEEVTAYNQAAIDAYAKAKERKAKQAGTKE